MREDLEPPPWARAYLNTDDAQTHATVTDTPGSVPPPTAPVSSVAAEETADDLASADDAAEPADRVSTTGAATSDVPATSADPATSDFADQEFTPPMPRSFAPEGFDGAEHHPVRQPSHPVPSPPPPGPLPGPGPHQDVAAPVWQPAPGVSAWQPRPGGLPPSPPPPPPVPRWGLDPDQLVRGAQQSPRRRWRGIMRAAGSGLISRGDSKSQEQLNELIWRVRQPIAGDYRIAVLSLKGGVGKTTTTISLGSAFASLRGDRIIAVDANPDLGTLGARVRQQTRSTVRTLLQDHDIERYSDVRRHTSQTISRLEILASERDPAMSEAFTADEYRSVLSILERFYNIIMTDCGTGLVHSAMNGVLQNANSIILVTSAAVDGAQSASATLDWLDAHGFHHLVRSAVVAISESRPGGAPIDLDMVTQYFLGRARAVQVIPFDSHLATGSYVDLERMSNTTKTAFLELAATIADAFPARRAPYAHPHPGTNPMYMNPDPSQTRSPRPS